MEEDLSICYLCSLEQGALIGDVLMMFKSMAMVVVGSLLLAGYPLSEYSDEDYTTALAIYYIAMGYLLVIPCVVLCFAISMKNRTLLLPWIIAFGLDLALNAVSIFAQFGKVRDIVIVIVKSTVLMFEIFGYTIVVCYYKSKKVLTVPRGGAVMNVLPQPGLSPISQLLGNTNYSFPNGEISPPAALAPDAYRILPPVVGFYPGEQVKPSNVVVPLFLVNPYLQPQDPTNTSDQPPPYYSES